MMGSRERRSTRGVLAAVAAACLLVLAGCGGDDDEGGAAGGGGGGGGGGASETAAAECKKSTGNVNLDFWSWVPGVEKAVEVWNADHPEIQVKVKETPAGNAPDLGQIEFDSLPSFRLQNGLVDVAPCGAGDAQGQFIDWTWQQVSFGEDAAYAVPQDTGPMAMYYRKDLFEKYGIEVPKTWEEYAAAARKVKDEDPDSFITHFPQRDTNWFAGLAWQAGARWFGLDGDTWNVSINDEPTKKVADYWQGLIEDKLVATNLQGFSEEWNKALADGKVLTWVSAVWGNNTITTNAPKTEGDWAVAPMPQWEEGGQSAGNWGGSTTSVLKDSEAPYEATQFALWLNTSPESLEILNKECGLYPATKNGNELEALQQPSEFFGGQNIFEVFGQAGGQVDEEFAWGPTMTQTYSDLADGFGRALNGNGTLGEAVDQAQEKTVSTMKQQSLQVAEG